MRLTRLVLPAPPPPYIAPSPRRPQLRTRPGIGAAAHFLVTLLLFLGQLLHFERHAEVGGTGQSSPQGGHGAGGPRPWAHRWASASLCRSASRARRCRSASMFRSMASVRPRSQDCSALATASSEATWRQGPVRAPAAQSWRSPAAPLWRRGRSLRKRGPAARLGPQVSRCSSPQNMPQGPLGRPASTCTTSLPAAPPLAVPRGPPPGHSPWDHPRPPLPSSLRSHWAPRPHPPTQQ